MSGVGLVAVASCGGYTVRFGPKTPLLYVHFPTEQRHTHEGPLTPLGGIGRRECFGSEERRDEQTDCISGYA